MDFPKNIESQEKGKEPPLTTRDLKEGVKTLIDGKQKRISALLAYPIQKSLVSENKFASGLVDLLEHDPNTLFQFELPNGTPLFLFRDHDSAYDAWKYMKEKTSMQHMSVIHIDAHNDLPEDTLVPVPSDAAHSETIIQSTTGHAQAWYLIPAIAKGYIKNLYWLGSPEKREQFIHMEKEGGMAKVSCNANPSDRFYGTSDTAKDLLEQLETRVPEQYAIDIDIDYFLDAQKLRGLSADEADTFIESRLTECVTALHQIQEKYGKPRCITIAYSPSYCAKKKSAKKIVERLWHAFSKTETRI